MRLTVSGSLNEEKKLLNCVRIDLLHNYYSKLNAIDFWNLGEIISLKPMICSVAHTEALRPIMVVNQMIKHEDDLRPLCFLSYPQSLTCPVSASTSLPPTSPTWSICAWMPTTSHTAACLLNTPPASAKLRTSCLSEELHLTNISCPDPTFRVNAAQPTFLRLSKAAVLLSNSTQCFVVSKILLCSIKMG